MRPTMQKKTYDVIITKDHENGGFVGRCDELHANTQGETYGETLENMKEVVELVAECLERDTNFNMLVIEK